MSVYEHEQGSYRSYRVARSINGHLNQRYFPRTNEGLRQARMLDREWQEEQSKARQLSTESMSHWRKPKPPLSAQKRSKTHNPAQIAELLRRIQNRERRAHG